MYHRFMYNRYMHHRFMHQRGGKGSLSVRRARRTKSRGPKGLQQEVGARRAPRLLFFILLHWFIFLYIIKLIYLSLYYQIEAKAPSKKVVLVLRRTAGASVGFNLGRQYGNKGRLVTTRLGQLLTYPALTFDFRHGQNWSKLVVNYGNGGGNLAPDIKSTQRTFGWHSLPPPFQVLTSSSLSFDIISFLAMVLTVMIYRDLLRVEASCQCLRNLVTGHQLYRTSYLRLCHQQVLLCRCILFYVSQYIYTGETFVVGKVTQSIHLGDESLLGRRYWPRDRTSGFKFTIEVVDLKISSF